MFVIALQTAGLITELKFDNIDGGAWKQGWPVTYNAAEHASQPLHAFVLPFSHNDPGWIKTFEDYFNQQTRNIISSIVDALAKVCMFIGTFGILPTTVFSLVGEQDKSRRFIWSEISYFHKWWHSVDQSTRDIAKE
jgi:alpha-mannosidase II